MLQRYSDCKEQLNSFYYICMGLCAICVIMLFVLIVLHLMIIKRNGISKKTINAIFILFGLMIAVKSAWFFKKGMELKTCYEIEISPWVNLFLDSMPMFFFVIGSLLNVGYSYHKYLLIAKSVNEFSNKPFDNKSFKRKLVISYVIISALIVGITIYYMY